MFLCNKQQNPITFEGKEIHITEKAANGHFVLCDLPITADTVRMYLGTFRDDRTSEEIAAEKSAEELSKIVEDGVKDEFVHLCHEAEWNAVPGKKAGD